MKIFGNVTCYCPINFSKKTFNLSRAVPLKKIFNGAAFAPGYETVQVVPAATQVHFLYVADTVSPKVEAPTLIFTNQ